MGVSRKQSMPNFSKNENVHGGDWRFNLSWSQTLWRTFFSRYKSINLGIGGKQAENVLWRVNDIALPKFFRSVVIHHGTNNVDTSSSDEISLGIVAIARSISHRHTTIEVIICGILPRDIHWST